MDSRKISPSSSNTVVPPSNQNVIQLTRNLIHVLINRWQHDGYLLHLHVQMPFYGCSDVQTYLSLRVVLVYYV